jgi:hypothetical protein
MGATGVVGATGATGVVMLTHHDEDDTYRCYGWSPEATSCGGSEGGIGGDYQSPLKIDFSI